MTHTVYSVNCPGCSRRIHAPSEDKRRAAVLRHIRNCAAIKWDSSLLVPEPQAPAPESAP